MKFEIAYLDGEVVFLEQPDLQYCFAGQEKVISQIRMLSGADSPIWKVVYTREFSEVIAYVNAKDGDVPIASVPLKVVVESYQRIKETKPIVEEINRIKSLCPGAKILVQKHFIWIK